MTVVQAAGTVARPRRNALIAWLLRVGARREHAVAKPSVLDLDAMPDWQRRDLGLADGRITGAALRRTGRS